MTKDEIQTRLESAEKQMIGLQDEIANLKAKLDEAQEEMIPEFPVFERGEDYWYLDIDGCIERSYSDGATEDNDFNMFYNDKYAKLYADKCREIAMLLHCKWYVEKELFKFNSGMLGNYPPVYTVVYDRPMDEYSVVKAHVYEGSQVYFKSKDAAQKAADWMNVHAKRGTNNDEETT